MAFVPLSAGMTLKGLNQKILAFYGHPAANRSSSTRLGALTVDCVTARETQLVVIDDLHFIDFRHRNGMEVSNHLKGLANEMPVTFIYVGVRLREKRFFDEGVLGPDAVYAQTSRRATRCEVAPFDITTDAGQRGWTDLLRALEGHLKLTDAHPGMLTTHAKELHRRTQGPHRVADQPDRPPLLPRHPHPHRDRHPRSPCCSDDRQRRPHPRHHPALDRAGSMPVEPTVGSAAEPAKEPPRRGSRIREVPAGYDLGPLPIKVPVRDGESVVSWLRRVSWRYDTPARTLMRDAGTPKPLTGTSKVAPRVHNNHQPLDRLGLPADDVARLLASTPLGAATTNYVKAFHRTTPDPRPWSRYCPTCLTGPDPYWRQDWQHPLLAICPGHDTYLHQACPSCRQRPQQDPAWLSRPIELWRCPAPLITLDHGPNGPQRRPSCTHNLRTTVPVSASPVEVAAQQLLLGWADDPIHTSTACGVTVTGRIGFDAFLDLVDAATKGTPFDLSHQPTDVAARLAEAAHILTRPDLDTAATAAAQLLSPSGPHAPLGPPTRFTTAAYNPLLAAVHVQRVRDQLSQADQLMFRTGHPQPRYPATPTPKNRRRLRLPDHHPNLPEPDGRRLPQLIWPDLVTAGPWGQATTSGRAVLAMALAKIGSTRTWAETAADLELPPSVVADVGPVLHRIDHQGHWPAVLTVLDTLVIRLQEEPAPIDYPARRRAGHDTASLRRALERAARTHPTSTSADVVLRHFWELFTGGDIAYAPDPLRIPLRTDPYRHHPRPRPAPAPDRTPRAQPTLRRWTVHRPPRLDTCRTNPALR